MARAMMLILALLVAHPTDKPTVGRKISSPARASSSPGAVHTMSGPVVVSVGERFWMTLNVSIGTDSLATVRHLSGAIYYDSTMVVPTGRAEALVGTLYPPKPVTRGAQYGVDCTFDPTAFPDENLYEDAGTDSVQWLGTYPGSIESITAWSHIPRIEWEGEASGDLARFEFMAISAGAAHITWSQARANCWEASLLSSNTNDIHKPTSTTWKLSGSSLLYHATITDTLYHRTAYSPVYVYGPNVTSWPNHPGGYQIYAGLSGGGAAYVGQTIDVEIDLWAGPEIPTDTWSIALVWNADGLELMSAVPHANRNWWNVWVGPKRDYTNNPSGDTNICGLDSAATAYVVAQHIKPGRPWPEVGGRFIDLTFRVRQAGTWYVNIGCPQENIAGLPSMPERVLLTTKAADAMFPTEAYNSAWRTRWGSYGVVTITGL